MSQVLNPAASLPLADSPELQQALAEANLPTLLAVYAHLSHDTAMLDRFADCIRPAFAPVPTAIPDDLAADLRSKLHHLLTTGEGLDAGAPDDALFQRIMTVMVGEPVEQEFIELVFDQCGFRPWIDRSALPGRASRRRSVARLAASRLAAPRVPGLRKAGVQHFAKHPE